MKQSQAPPGVVFDLEGDGLNPTKIHCMSIRDKNLDQAATTTDYDEIRNFFTDNKTIVGHSIRRFDLPVLKHLLGIDFGKHIVVDTLALSWYLEPNRKLHGLESYGEEFGVPKPKVTDWSDQDISVYIHRCEEDVHINWKLWTQQWNQLLEIYKGNEEKIWEFLQYLDFKMRTAQKQEESRWKLDVEYATETFNKLTTLKEHKINELAAAMPKVPVTKVKEYPAKPLKKDGTLSASGLKWREFVLERGLPATHREPIEYIDGFDDPNPNSHDQIKKWLYNLGWVPATLKIVRDKTTGKLREIPQINKEHGGGICESIKRLYPKEPRLEVLDGLSVISHRLSIISGFLRDVDEEGYLQARIQGLTNTLRFQHSEIVNLPKVGKPYGGEVRGCLTVNKDEILCGADMVSLEDRLKQHFMFKYDPEYVESVNQPGYDPHIALAIMGKMLTRDQGEAYIAGTGKQFKPIRDIAKNGNYSCQYGAGPPRIAITAGISLDQAKIVHKAYWDLNWAIKAVVEDQVYDHVGDQMWLLNPINGFYYSLRTPKDIFSTLVQGTASYVFDLWVAYIMAERDQITAQFHDEGVWCIKEGEEEMMTNIINQAIEQTNEALKLNRRLDVTIQFGKKYSEIH